MYPSDEEKMTFVKKGANYCYKVMPFDMKNVVATYQCFMDKVFADHIRSIKEVYMDNMVMKSIISNDHLPHL